MFHIDALIQAVPQPAEETIANPHQLIREVGRDLFHHADGFLLGFLWRDIAIADFVSHRFFDGLGVQQLVKQCFAIRQTWACGR